MVAVRVNDFLEIIVVLVAQISAYEAIQPIRSLTELRRRVGPYRRCYCLTHGALPREPLIVVHAALTTQISRTIQVPVTSHLGIHYGGFSCCRRHPITRQGHSPYCVYFCTASANDIKKRL